MCYPQLRNYILVPFIQSLKGIISYNLSCLIIIYVDLYWVPSLGLISLLWKTSKQTYVNHPLNLILPKMNLCIDYIFHLSSFLILEFFIHF